MEDCYLPLDFPSLSYSLIENSSSTLHQIWSSHCFPFLLSLSHPSHTLFSIRCDTFMVSRSVSLDPALLWQQVYSQIPPMAEIKWDVKNYIYIEDFFFQGRTCSIWKFPGQALNGAVAASLHHSPSNCRSEPPLQPTLHHGNSGSVIH